MIAHHCEIPLSPCSHSESLFSLAVRERYENRRKNGHNRLVSRVTANEKSARDERFNYRMLDFVMVVSKPSFPDAEAGEDGGEDVGWGDFSCDFSKVVHTFADVLAYEVSAYSIM